MYNVILVLLCSIDKIIKVEKYMCVFKDFYIDCVPFSHRPGTPLIFNAYFKLGWVKLRLVPRRDSSLLDWSPLHSC